MRTLTLTACWLALAWSCVGLCRGATQDVGGFTVTRLGPVAENFTAVLSPDKRRMAYELPQGGKKQMLLDGSPIGSEFTETFYAQSAAFSPRGDRLAYALVRETEHCDTCPPAGIWRAVIDGHEGAEYDLVHGLVFSPDGKRVAYSAFIRNGDGVQWMLIVDDKEILLPYEAISRESPVFTPDSKHVVYIAKKGEKAVVVVDGKEDAPHDKIHDSIPTFSPDGSHRAYVARDFGEGPDSGKDRVVIDGKAGPAFDFVPPQSLIFSPDGQHHAYGAQRGGVVPQDSSTWTVVLDGKEGPAYDQVDNLRFGPDGSHFIYKARRGDRWFLVIDGEPGLPFESLVDGFPTFSPEGDRLAYGFKTEGRWRVFIHALDRSKSAGLVGNMGDDYDAVGAITFSPDGRRLVFGASRADKRLLVIDGVEAAPWKGLSWDMTRNLVLSPDGRRIACEVGTKHPTSDDKWEFVVDGQTLPHQTPVTGSLVFSTDSRHFAFLVMDGDRQRIIVDGLSGPDYGSIGQIFPTSANGFEALVVGKDLGRLVWAPR